MYKLWMLLQDHPFTSAGGEFCSLDKSFGNMYPHRAMQNRINDGTKSRKTSEQ
jgi:hypothetical protein